MKWTHLQAGGGTINLNLNRHTVTLGGGAGADSRLRSNLRSFPIWRPKVVFRVKFSLQAGLNEYFVGLQLDRAATLGEGVQGVYLVVPSGADPFFRARKASSNTDSTTLTDPGDGTWFEVSIEYTADDAVSCKLDGVERTFSGAAVPSTTDQFFAEVHLNTDGVTTADIDRIEHRNTLLANSL